MQALEEQARRMLEVNQQLLEENKRMQEEMDKQKVAAAEAEEKRKKDEAARKAEAEARARTMPFAAGPVDTKVVSKPEHFTGREEDWPKFSVLMRAYVGALSPRMLELLKMAEQPEAPIDRVDLDPGDDILDTQLYFVLAMLLKEGSLDKLELVEHGEGLHLWRLLIGEFEPRWKSRKTALHQQILNFAMMDDVLKAFDSFERLVRQYKTTTGKTIDDDTKAGVILRALGQSSVPRHAELAEHIIMNSQRLDTYDAIKKEVKEILGTKKYLSGKANVDISAVSKAKGGKGKGKEKGKDKGSSSKGASQGGAGRGKGDTFKVKFEGECWICGKKGHRKMDCWHNDQKPQAEQRKKKCEYCGAEGHIKSACRKFKADQAARAGGNGQGTKRARTDISQIEEQLRNLTLAVGEYKKQDGEIGSIDLCSIEKEAQKLSVMAVEARRNEAHVTIGLDSGAEIAVWPPDLLPEVETQESPESRRGVAYFGPGDRDGPILRNLGRRKYQLDLNGVQANMKAHVVAVRKPLLALCDLVDHGHDFFVVDGIAWIVHRRTNQVIEVHRRGGKFELDAKVKLPSPNGAGHAEQ